jgi:hypothetical protein
MKLLRNISLLLFICVVGLSLAPSFGNAADKSCIKNGDLQAGCKLDSKGSLGIPDQSIAATASNIVTILGIIAGVTSVIFLILGGINYITSEGDPAKLKGAKSTITYAIAGLAVSILAPAIVGFVLQYSPQ